MILLLASSLVVIYHLSTTGEEFSRYNVGWSGTSDFFSSLDRHTTRDMTGPSELAGYTGTTLLLIAPDHNFTKKDGALYRAYLERGNTVLLADDFGTGNSFLQSVGSSILIHPGNLSSTDRAYSDAWMVVVYPVGDNRLFRAGSSLVLNKAATLEGGEPLLNSTVFSWVDTTPDKKLSAGEGLGTYTVMAAEKIGEGTLYVLTDPSIFINGMKDPSPSYTNRAFLLEFAHTPTPILIDTYASRTGRVDGAGEIIQSVRINNDIKYLIAALLMAGIALAWYRRII
jgi:hypothetical protein